MFVLIIFPVFFFQVAVFIDLFVVISVFYICGYKRQKSQQTNLIHSLLILGFLLMFKSGVYKANWEFLRTSSCLTVSL